MAGGTGPTFGGCLSESYIINQSALCLLMMIQFGENVQHATCFLAGKQANVPRWEPRLSREDFLWSSPPQINHRLNMSTLSVILFLHFTFYMVGQTAFVFGSLIKSNDQVF